MKDRSAWASVEDRRRLAEWIARSAARCSAETAPASKERSIAFDKEMVRALLDGRKTQTRRRMKFGRDGVAAPSPGAVGETLWVRERFAPAVDAEGSVRFVYAADATWQHGPAVRWRMSNHMPRGASRVSVRVLAVRSERIQDVSDADVLAEGFPNDAPGEPPVRPTCQPRVWFEELWDRLSPEGAKWADNPAVWVLHFERVIGRSVGDEVRI